MSGFQEEQERDSARFRVRERCPIKGDRAGSSQLTPQSFGQINGPWTAAAARVARVPPTTCVNYDEASERGCPRGRER